MQSGSPPKNKIRNREKITTCFSKNTIKYSGNNVFKSYTQEICLVLKDLINCAKNEKICRYLNVFHKLSTIGAQPVDNPPTNSLTKSLALIKAYTAPIHINLLNKLE